MKNIEDAFAEAVEKDYRVASLAKAAGNEDYRLVETKEEGDGRFVFRIRGKERWTQERGKQNIVAHGFWDGETLTVSAAYLEKAGE
mgnify:FL=1